MSNNHPLPAGRGIAKSRPADDASGRSASQLREAVRPSDHPAGSTPKNTICIFTFSKQLMMSQPVIQINSGENGRPKVAVNLLPCTVHHDGPINSVRAYWRPTEVDGKKIAYFRGRRLQGRTVRVPEGYKGLVVERSKDEPSRQQMAEDKPPAIDLDAGDTDELEADQMVAKGEFSEITVWNHEAVADASIDPYVRGIEEWVSLSNQIHSY